MTRRRIITIAFIFMLAVSIRPVGAAQAAGTDEIKHYTIDILPQTDASLMDTYGINWCVISNSAGPLLWFTVGMPNDQYQVVGFSGDAASAVPNNEGFDYKIRVDLTRQVNAGDCVNVTVQIHQYGLANLDKTSDQIGFQFTPGWFNDVPVDHLQIIWHLSADPTQLKSLAPKPANQTDSQAVWESALQPGDKYPISVAYDKAAFPAFNPAQTGLPGSSGPATQGSVPPTAVSSAPGESGVPAPVEPVAIPPLTLSNCICGCIILIVVLIVLIGFLRLISSAGRSYRGGGFLGGYPRGGGWLGGGGFGSGGGGGGSIFSRTGGGSGSFGGRGMSCACVSSGCACACAGGGRAGCSRKGFDVSSLFKVDQVYDQP
jgi:hypothetical protein